MATLLASIILFLNTVDSTIYRVDSTISNPGNGLLWSTAYDDLSSALSVATSGDQIWLKGPQTYKPSTSHRDNCFYVNEGVMIYGGFRGIESSIAAREQDDTLKLNYETVISGNIGTASKISDNCYHVLTFSDTIILNRVTVSDGNANVEYDPTDGASRYILDGFGGALITDDILQAQSITLDEVIFKDNTAINGGALWFGASYDITVQVVIRNCKFINNVALNGLYEGGYGGAIYAYSQVEILAALTDFEHNYAEFRGGAVYQDYAAHFTCGSCNFNNNTARGYGGALFAEERYIKAETNTRITSTHFENNNATIFGGGIALFGNNVTGIFQGSWTECEANFGGAHANIYGSLHFAGSVSYSENVARLDSSTKDEYEESEFLFTSVDSELEFELDVILLDVQDLYERKIEQIDLYPIEAATDLCYVDSESSAALIFQTGVSWINAYSDLQDCIDQLASNINGGEIWVKGSETNKYVPSSVPPQKDETRLEDRSFILYDNIRIYGGFAGDETSRYDRNIAENPSYLSGVIIADIRVINLVFAYDVSGVLIDGFILEEAGCSSSVDDLRAGGGLYSVFTNIAIVNCIFHKLCSRTHGGAIFSFGKNTNEDSLTSTIMNTVFLGNVASFNGGAIFASGNSYFTCKWCDFWDNSASRIGGAVYLWQDTLAFFESSSFIRNYARNSGGCVAVEQEAEAIFYCGKFYNNSARFEGGCLYAGFGDDIQEKNTFQGFEDYGPSNFVDNYLMNSGSFDRGQNDIYLWPYTKYITREIDCGGSGTQPTAPPADAPTTPSAINCGEIVSGLFANQALIFPFAITSSYIVTFRSCHSNFNTQISLYDDTDESLIASDSNSCPNNENALLIVSLDAGEYYIELDGSGTTIGTFFLSITCDATEIVTTTSEPSQIPTLPPTNTGRLCCGETKTGEYNNMDIWMWFDLHDTLKVIFTSCESKFDTRLELYQEDQIILLGSDENGCGINGGAQLTVDLLLAGRYYIKLSAGAAISESEVFSEFTLGIICIPPQIQPEKHRIECLETKFGSFEAESMIFEFDLLHNNDAVIINTCGSDFNTKLTLYDDTLTHVIDSCINCGIGGNLRADCDANDPNVCCSGNPLNSQLTVDIAAGRYYIILDAVEAATFGSYVLYLDCPFGGIEPTPAPTPPGIFYCNEGHFGEYNDETIIIPFLLEEKYGVSSVDFIACNSNFDTIVYLYDDDANLLGFDDDGCDNGAIQSVLEMSALRPGILYKYHLSSKAAAADVYGLYSFNIVCESLVPSVTTTPAPSRPPAIDCFETIGGDYNNKEILFQFDLEFASLVRFSSCGSNFNTQIALKDAQLTEIRDECKNCGTIANLGDCSFKLGEICCDDGSLSGAFQSELEVAMTPGRYYWTLKHNDAIASDVFGEYQVSLDCVGVPTIATSLAPTSAPTPAPTPSPTTATATAVWPTKRPDYNVPDSCSDRCDAFSVNVLNVEKDEDTICITYHVERMISVGYYCYRPVQYIVLGVCDGDSIIDNPYRGCSQTDLNGLLLSFRIIEMNDDTDSDSDSDSADSANSQSDSDDSANSGSGSVSVSDDSTNSGSGSSSDSSSSSSRRRLGGTASSSYSKQAFGTISESVYGIMINMEIDESATFEICLRNVFKDDIEFSDNVRFRRGYNKFTCNDEWIVGLPCLDSSKFRQGIYSNLGFNSFGKRYGNYYRKKRHRAQGAQIELEDISILSTQHLVTWEVLSCIILFALCFIGIIVYVLVLRRKKLNNYSMTKKREERERVSTYDVDASDDDASDSDSKSKSRVLPHAHMHNNEYQEGDKDELEMQETRRLVGE